MGSYRFSRGTFLKGAVGVTATAFALGQAGRARATAAESVGPATEQADRVIVYAGCYTTPDRNGHGQGIGVYLMDPASGDWEPIQVLKGVDNPSFLTLDSKGRFLYCVHGGNFSDVSAFAIDQRSGEISFLNKQSSGGANPVHLSLDPSDRFLVVANYTGGTIAALPVDADGRLAAASDVVKLVGENGPNRLEQAGPHPHDIPFDPQGRFVVVPDKGLDRVFVFRLDTALGKLVPTDPPSVETRHGAGPRHVAFHPSGSFAYVIDELDSTVTTYAYDQEAGTLAPLQIVTTLPPEFTGNNTCSEIAVAPSGRFVYGSNRGHDSLAIFSVDPAAGTLTSVGWVPTQGRTPRAFSLDPSGTLLYVGNQDSDTVVTFRVDQTTGELIPTGQVIQTGSPVSFVFRAG